MKKIIVALIASLALAQGAYAAEPAPANATTAAVRDLLDAMHYRATWQASVEQMSKAMPNMMRQQAEAAINGNTSLTDVQRKEQMKKLDADLPKMAEVIRNVMNDPAVISEMETEVVALYARHFSADEVKQIAAYYRTPIGAKSLQLMPQIMGESMAISQRVTGPRIQKAMEQFRKK
ncbi:DUF2059 domain-containing protein [Pseudoduganella eburnea]|uniref:DUF2059 domain-containing protein n=1 Tax=Massilia eburnea TaxID=1776165 RepID=A0A6L6QE28_9BURK|nr:DUF2059 domain-containing protein [Massilia eburnea]MTW10622.1 DUF2059 domain-containing protein [Massilia eburnea]